MKTVGSYQAKTHLPSLLEEVSKGEKIAITRHGVTIAYLVPADEKPRRDPDVALARLRELRKGVTLGGTSIRELIDEGRRD